ncbi:MAG: hypothetical protein R3Y51_03035 [Rikenellaceae bacterium]
MRRPFLILFLLFPVVLCAQLRERIVAGDGTQVVSQNYDTLSNAPKMWKGYVNQEVIFLPLDLEFSDTYTVYDCFFSDRECTSTYLGDSITPVQYIENKKFTIFGYDIIYRYEDEKNAALIFEMFSDNGKLVFWKIPYYAKENSVSNIYSNAVLGERVTLSLPIVIDSFIKRNEEHIGKKFVAKDSIDNNKFEDMAQMIDLNSGKEITIEKHKMYECVDLTLMSCDEYYKQPFLIFKDEKNVEFRVAFMKTAGVAEETDYRLSILDFYSEKEWNKIEEDRIRQENAFKKLKEMRSSELVERYGEETGKLIASGVVKVGMTTEMCELALGKPEMTNKVQFEGLTYEVWEYNLTSNSRKTLYFENNKLKMVQE